MILTSFMYNYFQSLVSILLLKFDNLQQFRVAKIWLIDKFFYYRLNKVHFFLLRFLN